MKEYTRRELLFEKDFPPIGPITEEDVKRAQELSLSFYTEHEIEKLREKSDKLP